VTMTAIDCAFALTCQYVHGATLAVVGSGI
jgi:hypothetical protein